MTESDSTHIEAIVTLVESVYRGELSHQGWTSEAHLLEGQRVDSSMVREMINKKNSVVLIYENFSNDKNEILACVHLEKSDDSVHLGMLSVRAHLQGQKIGQKILNFCEAYAIDQWDKRELAIEVLQQRTELIAWYERRGFIKTGKIKPFPVDPRFGVPKVSDLYFLELKKKLFIKK